jgi:hypothetical protein
MARAMSPQITVNNEVPSRGGGGLTSAPGGINISIGRGYFSGL